MIRLGLAYLVLAILVVIGVAGLPGASLFSGGESAPAAAPEQVAAPEPVASLPAPPQVPVPPQAPASPALAPPAPLPVLAMAPAQIAPQPDPALSPASAAPPLQDLSVLALRNLRAARALTATTGPDALARIVRQANAYRSEDPHLLALLQEASLFPPPQFSTATPPGPGAAVPGLFLPQGREEFGEGDLSEPDLVLPYPRSGDLVHVVGPGDSLGSLALRYYGDAAHYLTLYTANQALLATPDGLRVGQSIVIPDLSQP